MTEPCTGVEAISLRPDEMARRLCCPTVAFRRRLPRRTINQDAAKSLRPRSIAASCLRARCLVASRFSRFGAAMDP